MDGSSIEAKICHGDGRFDFIVAEDINLVRFSTGEDIRYECFGGFRQCSPRL